MSDIYSKIFSDINRRYVIGYYSSNQERDERRRRVSVEVRGHPEYEVWGGNHTTRPTRKNKGFPLISKDDMAICVTAAATESVTTALIFRLKEGTARPSKSLNARRNKRLS